MSGRAHRVDGQVCPLGDTPWAPTATTRVPSTATTRAPSVSGVIGRLLAPRRAPPHVRARTGSICVRVVLRRGGPCGAPEPLGAPCEPGTCLVCTPSGGGRSTGCMATAHDHEDPAPSTGRARAGACVRPARASRCARGSRACVQPSGTYGTSARRGPGGCGWAVSPMAITRAHKDPALSPQHAHARHHIACRAGAPGGGSPAPGPPGTHGTGPTCTPHEGGSTARPVAPTLGAQGGARDARASAQGST